LKDYGSGRYKNVVISILLQSYTHWRRILKYLYVAGYKDIELEEFYNNISDSELTGYLSSKDIATVLRKSVEEVIRKYCQNGSHGKVFSKTCKKIKDLPGPRKKPYDRNSPREEIEVYNSFRPSVSTTITADKLEQVIISSGSENEDDEDIEIIEQINFNAERQNLNGQAQTNHNKIHKEECVQEAISSKDSETNYYEKQMELNAKISSLNKQISQTEGKWDIIDTDMLVCPFCPNQTKLRFINVRKHLANHHKRHKDEMSFECARCPMILSPEMLCQHIKDYPSHIQKFVKKKKAKAAQHSWGSLAELGTKRKSKNGNKRAPQIPPDIPRGPLHTTVRSLGHLTMRIKCGSDPDPLHLNPPPYNIHTPEPEQLQEQNTIHSVETDHGLLTNYKRNFYH